MTLAEIIRGRRSIGLWQDTPIPDGLIEDILETAVWAPNHHLTEPWRFVLLKGEAMEGWAQIHGQFAYEWAVTQSDDAERHAAARAKEYRNKRAIPAILFVVMKESPDPHVWEEDYAACCCLTQNIMLLAWERGLGTSWKSFGHRQIRLRTYLGLADDERVVGYLHIGYPAKVPPGRARSSPRERLTVISTTETPPGYDSFAAFRTDKRLVPDTH